jgi:hypothetical protein
VQELAKELPTFKDNDFTTANERIFLGPEAKAEIMARIKLDVEFLCRLHLMDYSLLVGIHEYDMVVLFLLFFSRGGSVGLTPNLCTVHVRRTARARPDEQRVCSF